MEMKEENANPRKNLSFIPLFKNQKPYRIGIQILSHKSCIFQLYQSASVFFRRTNYKLHLFYLRLKNTIKRISHFHFIRCSKFVGIDFHAHPRLIRSWIVFGDQKCAIVLSWKSTKRMAAHQQWKIFSHNTNNAKRASACTGRAFFFAFSARANIKFKKGGSLFNDAYLIAALPGRPWAKKADKSAISDRPNLPIWILVKEQ